MSSSPQRLQPLYTPTVILVELIADRTFLIEILMILFRGIELRRRDNFRHDGLFKRLGLVDPLLRFFGKPFLIVVMIENGGPILMAFVAELLIGRRGIDVVPERI